MNVLARGLILVLVPLVFELGVFAVLVPMLEAEAQAAAKEAKIRSIVFAADELAIMIVRAGSQIVSAALEPHSQVSIRKKHDELLGAIQARRRSIDAIAKGDPNFEELAKTVDQQTELALTYMRPPNSPPIDTPPFVLAMSLSPKLAAVSNEILEATHKFHGRDQSTKSAFPELEQARIRGIKSVLWISILVSIVLSLVMVVFFAATFVTRISLLRANSERFSKKQVLLPPLKGRDELHELDVAFRAMYDKVNQAAAEKQQFFAMVSHDLRSPLTSFRLLLNLLGSEILGALNEKGKRKVEAAESDIDRLLSLINDILDAERLEQGQLELARQPIEIEAVITRAARSVMSIAESKRLNIEISSENETVYADSDRIVQVLVNLISNAIKYAPFDSAIHVNAKRREKLVFVEVTDSGPGIPADKQKALFERFKQVSAADASTGTGLGLFICKAIVSQHGGEIGVSSEFGHGTTFWFSLPVSKQ